MGLKEAIAKVNDAIKYADEVAKKLTTKDRKKLRKTVFCGPNRSFPVPDCKHVAVAKAYLNRSKFSKATKQRIAACINRRAKQLGCSTVKPAKVKGSFDYTFDSLPNELKVLAESSIFETTKELVDQSLENAELELNFECEDCD